MVRTVIDELRQLLREMPGLAAAVLVVVVLGVGAHAAVFYEADGEELRLVADRSKPHALDESADPISRMRARIACAEKVPGFTVIVGLSEYNVELSVPVVGMRSLFEDARADVARALTTPDTSSAA
jgi:hypothetical protein